MPVLKVLSDCKNYSQLTKQLKPFFKSGELVLFQTIYNQYCSILHGDHLITIRSDYLSYHSGDILYTYRSENEKGSYGIVRESRKEVPPRNTGLKDFYDMLMKIDLGLEY